MKTYVSEFWIGVGKDRVLATTMRAPADSIETIRAGLSTGEVKLTYENGKLVPEEIKNTFAVLVISREVPTTMGDTINQLKLL